MGTWQSNSNLHRCNSKMGGPIICCRYVMLITVVIETFEKDPGIPNQDMKKNAKNNVYNLQQLGTQSIHGQTWQMRPCLETHYLLGDDPMLSRTQLDTWLEGKRPLREMGQMSDRVFAINEPIGLLLTHSLQEKLVSFLGPKKNMHKHTFLRGPIFQTKNLLIMLKILIWIRNIKPIIWKLINYLNEF